MFYLNKWQNIEEVLIHLSFKISPPRKTICKTGKQALGASHPSAKNVSTWHEKRRRKQKEHFHNLLEAANRLRNPCPLHVYLTTAHAQLDLVSHTKVFGQTLQVIFFIGKKFGLHARLRLQSSISFLLLHCYNFNANSLKVWRLC